MEDIYGRGGAGRPANNGGGQYGGQYNQYNQNSQFGQNGNFQNSQNFQNGGFQNNQFQQQNQNQFQNYNQQDFQNQQNNSIYEHLTPQVRFQNLFLLSSATTKMLSSANARTNLKR